MSNNTVKIFYGGFLDKSGGAFMHARLLSEELLKNKWNVEIITLDQLPFLVKYWPHLTQYFFNLFLPPLGYYYKGRLTSKLYQLFFGKDVSFRVFEDIYLSWNSDVPSLTLLHAVWSDNLQALSIDASQKSCLIRKEAKLLNQINHPIVTVSEPYLRYLGSEHFSGYQIPQIHVIPLGLNLALFEKNNNLNRMSKSIVYCGTLEPRKNVSFLLRVFDKLYRKDTDFKLTVIGDGPERQKLQSLTSSQKLPVRFLGRLNHAEVINELLNHEIYMHASVKESFSFSLLEAKLSGLKTCAFHGLEVPEEFIDVPMNSFDVDEWYQKIISIDQIDNVFEANRYSSKNMAEATLNLVQPTERYFKMKSQH